MVDRQNHALSLHQIGSKMNIHSLGQPIDPVNHFYLNNLKGRYQEAADRNKQINQLVRSHKLQTYGSSGYNIINGQNSLTVEQMVPEDNHHVFEQKLSRYYEKFRINLNHN